MTNLKESRPPSITLYVTEETWLQERQGISRIKVEACGTCGYVEMFLETPEVVYDEWRKHNV